MPATGEAQAPRRRGRRSRAPSMPSAAAAHLDEVQPGRQLGREVDDDGPPSGVVASIAAGIVADVLTTTRSPASQPRGQVAGDALAWRLLADRHQHPHGVAAAERRARAVRSPPARPAGRSGPGRRSDGGQGVTRRRLAARGTGRSAVTVDQGEEPRHAVLRRRTVGDVLAGEGVLVHLRAHVAGVDAQHPEVGALDGEDPADVVQRGLGGAVAAPALVGLDGGVGRDVDHDGARREVRQRVLDQPERGDDVDVEQVGERGERVVGQRRQRRRAEAAGVVDDEVDRPRRRRPTRAARWSGSVTSPGTATTRAKPATARAARPASRPSVTTFHPRRPARGPGRGRDPSILR